MKFKKILLSCAAVVLLLSAVPQTTTAQTSFGVSYEIRQEKPKNGFGARIEQNIFQKFPIVNLAIRAHFSYFNEANDVSRQNGSTTITYGQEITNYDYGLAAVGGVTVGPISPYVGLGLGASTLDVSRSDLPSGSAFDDSANDSAIYWNGFVGARLSALPIQPFIEYRLEDVSNYKDELSDVKNSNGRMIFGVSLSF